MGRSIISDDRLEEIKKEITFMYEECGIETCPIDCFEIARKLFYVLRPYSTLNPTQLQEALAIDPDGYSKVEYNSQTGMYQYVIYYNDSGIHGRIRWTIFHEIGHIYLGHHDNPDNRNLIYEEAEAEFFAKYAFAPPPLVRAHKCTNPYEVADIFDASFEAACNIFEYYTKRRNYGPRNLTRFELKILTLFHAA